MHHKAHVWLVNAHPECDLCHASAHEAHDTTLNTTYRGDDHIHVIRGPQAQHFSALAVLHARVIGARVHAVLFELLCELVTVAHCR
jgi:hypothetical protein